MSSETQSILASIQLNDYISGMSVVTFSRTISQTMTVAVATAVGYDFILTFANEIEYVWQRPWTWVSTLFVVVRYVGCVTALVGAFFGSTMMPGPVITCRVMNMIAKSAFPVFIGASDFLMILRVYAMYDQSRGMLAILVIYISVMVLVIANAAYIMAEKTYLTVVLEVANVKICVLTDNIPLISTYTVIALLTLGVLLCILAVAKFVSQSLEMHKAIKQWRLDRYMKLFVRESILYFIANLLSYVVYCIPNSGTPYIVLLIISGVFPYLLGPRFVLSVRELYSNAVGEHIDTGFGAVSHVNTIVFANLGNTLAGSAETARGEGSSEGAQVYSDDRGTALGEEAADGASSMRQALDVCPTQTR